MLHVIGGRKKALSGLKKERKAKWWPGLHGRAKGKRVTKGSRKSLFLGGERRERRTSRKSKRQFDPKPRVGE